MKNEHNIEIVVISCDNYSDIWPFFFKSFYYHWSNCPLRLSLISNNKKFVYKDVKNILVGNDISWSDNLIKGLEYIEKDYVLLMIDDLLLNKKISSKFFMMISDWININDPNHVRLHISNKPNFYNSFIGKISNKIPYKISLMPSIWKKSFLLNILKKGESAWEFEINGTKRAFKHDEFYSLYNNLIFYENSIIKGKWQRSIAKKLMVKNDLRPIMSIKEQIVYNSKFLLYKIFNFLPICIRLKLKKL